MHGTSFETKHISSTEPTSASPERAYIVSKLQKYTPNSKEKYLINKVALLQKEKQETLATHRKNLYRANRQTTANKNRAEDYKSQLQKIGAYSHGNQKIPDNRHKSQATISNQRYRTGLRVLSSQVTSSQQVKELDKHIHDEGLTTELTKSKYTAAEIETIYDEARKAYENDPERHRDEFVQCAMSGKSLNQHIRDRTIYGQTREVATDIDGYGCLKRAKPTKLPNGNTVPQPVARKAYELARQAEFAENNKIAPLTSIRLSDEYINQREIFRDGYKCCLQTLLLLFSPAVCKKHIPFHHSNFCENDFFDITTFESEFLDDDEKKQLHQRFHEINTNKSTNIQNCQFAGYDFLSCVSGDGSYTKNTTEDVDNFAALILKICAVNEYMQSTLYGGGLLAFYTVKEESSPITNRCNEYLEQLTGNTIFLLKHPTIPNGYVAMRNHPQCVPDWKFLVYHIVKAFPASAKRPFPGVWVMHTSIESENVADKISQPMKQGIGDLLTYEYKEQPFDDLETMNQYETDCWGLIDQQMGCLLAQKIEDEVEPKESFENESGYWEACKDAARKLGQCILAFSFWFGMLAWDIHHPFWTGWRTAMSIIFYVMIEEFGLSNEQLVTAAKKLKVVSITRQVQKHVSSGPSVRSKRLKLAASGNQCKRGMYHSHEFIITGSHFTKTKAQHLIWATLWVFFIDFRFCLYILFISFFDLSDPKSRKLLDDGIDTGDRLIFIFDAYMDWMLFPYMIKILLFLMRMQKRFVIAMNGIASGVCGTQYPEKIIGKFHTNFETQNSNKGDWALYAVNCLDVVLWSPLRRNLANLNTLRIKWENKTGERYPIYSDELNEEAMKSREHELSSPVRALVKLVRQIDHKTGYIPPEIEAIVAADPSDKNEEMNQADAKPGKLLKKLNKKKVLKIASSISKESRCDGGLKARQIRKDMEKMPGDISEESDDLSDPSTNDEEWERLSDSGTSSINSSFEFDNSYATDSDDASSDDASSDSISGQRGTIASRMKKRLQKDKNSNEPKNTNNKTKCKKPVRLSNKRKNINKKPNNEKTKSNKIQCKTNSKKSKRGSTLRKRKTRVGKFSGSMMRKQNSNQNSNDNSNHTNSKKTSKPKNKSTNNAQNKSKQTKMSPPRTRSKTKTKTKTKNKNQK